MTKAQKLDKDAKVLLAHAGNDITIQNFSTVLQPVDDTLLQKGGGKGLALYDEVAKDGHTYAVLNKRNAQLVGREWLVDAASEDSIDIEAADFVREILNNLTFDKGDIELPEQRITSFDQLTISLASAILKGFAVAEIVWTKDGSRIVPERIVAHDQRRFVFDRNWKPRLKTLSNLIDGEELPAGKFIVHRVGVEQNFSPYGLGLGHKLFWPVLFKREGVAFWMHFLERFAAPVPVGKYPIGLLDAEQQKLLNSLLELAAGRAVALPMGAEAEFLEAKRAGEAGYDKWCRYWDEQITETVLGETLTTNLHGGGSHAAANTHAEILEKLVDSDGDLQSATLQNSLIRWLTLFNFPGARVPTVWRPQTENELATEDLAKKRAERRSADMEALAAARAQGFEPKNLDAWMADRFGVEMTPIEVKTTDPNLPQKKTSELAIAFSEGQTDLIGDLISYAKASAAPLVEGWLDQILTALQRAEDVKAAHQALLSVATELDLSAFTKSFGDQIALASLIGRSSVLDELNETFDASENTIGGQTFLEQLEFFRQKVNLPTNRWTDLMHHAHDRAFVVAGATSDALISDLRGAMDKAIAEGTTLETFRQDFDQIVADHGWSYRGKRDWRTRVIFDTNLRTSYQAGRLKQMRDPAVTKLRPYWQYDHAQTRIPKSPRPKHKGWDGLILRHDDPFWSTHFPPNGWLCSCGVRTLSKRDLERAGKSAPDDSPNIHYRNERDPATGEVVKVPEDVSVGFAYQPGDRWERGIVPRELQRPLESNWFDLTVHLTALADIAKPFTSALLKPGQDPETYASAFLERFGASVDNGIIYRDKAGQAVVISDQLFKRADGRWKIDKQRGPAMARLAEAVQDPDEIWIDFARDEQNGITLVRRYLRYDPETNGFAVFNWSHTGWTGATVFSPRRGRKQTADSDYLERHRVGALVYRRNERD